MHLQQSNRASFNFLVFGMRKKLKSVIRDLCKLDANRHSTFFAEKISIQLLVSHLTAKTAMNLFFTFLFYFIFCRPKPGSNFFLRHTTVEICSSFSCVPTRFDAFRMIDFNKRIKDRASFFGGRLRWHRLNWVVNTELGDVKGTISWIKFNAFRQIFTFTTEGCCAWGREKRYQFRCKQF